MTSNVKTKIRNLFKFGIGQKIYASMGVLIIIALVMAGTTFTMISSISKSTETLAQKSLPQIVEGGKLSEQSAKLISQVNTLIKTQERKEVQSVQKQAETTLADISTLIQSMNLSDDEKDALSKELNSIKTIIPKLAKNTTKRLTVIERAQAKIKDAKELRLKLITDASPLYDDAEFNLMISLGDLADVGKVVKLEEASKIQNPVMVNNTNAGANIAASSLPTVDMNNVSSELDKNITVLQSSLKYIAEINLLAGYYSTAEHLDSKENLVPLQELYTTVSEKIESIIKSIESEEIKKNTKELISFGKGNDSIFSLREQYFINFQASEKLTKELNNTLNNLQSDVQERSLQIKTTAQNDGQNAIILSKNIKDTILTMTALLLIVALATGILYVRPAIVKRFIAVYHVTEKIAAGDLEIEIKKSGTDELAQMSEALIHFRDNAKARLELEEEQKETEARQAEDRKQTMIMMADQFEEQVGKIVETVAGAAHKMQQMTEQLSQTIQNASSRSDTVVQAASQASNNVQALAAATEEMSASIREISGNVSDTADKTKDCASFAQESQEKVDQLSAAVGDIEAVIQSINDVAEQTNLLALNATIEAARAGEAGKGFAVVANEVKALASQTHDMTEEISNKVAHMKDSAADTISSVNGILTQISSVDEKTSEVATAVEEQNNATAEISKNIQEAASGTDSVSHNMQDIQQATNESANSTEELKEASDKLTEQAKQLQASVKDFLSEIRAA